MKRLWLLMAVVLFLWAGASLAQSARSYDEGAVVVVSSIRVKDGQWDNYMAYLAGPYRRLLDAQKEAGVIVDWSVYATEPRSPADPNLYLTVVYANMAAFDGLEDKTEPLATRVLSQSRSDGEKKYAERSTLREVLGSERIREIKLRAAK
jgi:hypothetical protein